MNVPTRNPVITYKDIVINTIGDPHLGRVFKNNVPKNNIGVRENLICKEFISHINPSNSPNFVVIMGDLFDKTNIQNNVLWFAIQELSKASVANPDITYVILAGNHDLSKDTHLKSSFSLFLLFFTQNKDMYSNIKIMHSDNEAEWYFSTDSVDLYFIPYLPFTEVDQKDFFKPKTKYTICFGHWDVTDFSKLSGTSTFHINSIPKSVLNNADLVVTGHEHLPKITKLGLNLKCIVTGSMQPYAHGEQLGTELLYKTEDLDTVVGNLNKDTEFYSNTNLRINLKLEETVPVFNCLSVMYTYQKEVQENKVEVEEELSNTIQPLSFSTLLYERLQETSDDNLIALNKYLEDCFMNKTYDTWKFNEQST